jgi:hypothetical protein
MLISTKVMVFKRGDIKQKEKSRKGLLLAKKEDIKQALASAGAVFMIWAKQLLQVEGLDLPRQIKELLEEFKDVFPDELPKGLPPIRGIKHQIDLVSGLMMCIMGIIIHLVKLNLIYKKIQMAQ